MVLRLLKHQHAVTFISLVKTHFVLGSFCAVMVFAAFVFVLTAVKPFYPVSKSAIHIGY